MTRRARRCLVVLALWAIAMAPPAASGAQDAAHKNGKTVKRAPARARSAPKTTPPAPASVDPQKEQTDQTAERDRLTARIAELHKQIAAGEKSRSGAAAALAKAETALAVVTRRLDEVAQRQKTAQELVATLDRQRAGTEGQIAAGRAEVARTVMRVYANHDRDPVKTWLAGGDPNAALRTDGYLHRVVVARKADVDGLLAHATDLEAQRSRADEENRALAQQADAERSAREALASDQAAQRQALAQLSQRLAAQRSTANALEADEKRLGRVIEQLQKAFERRAAEERARREAARKRAEQQAAAAAAQKQRSNAGTAPKKGREVVPPAPVEPPPDEPIGNGAFAQLRGQLRLPVRGAVTGRYGAPRGSSGATWKGVFVKSEAGADVHAVAAGKVIFADDLRGFGNLLIIDHGNQYLSIYGNNDTLLRHAGDAVQAGDVVSRAGNSGGDDQTGLYFELRFRGRPLDPMPWIGSR